MSTPASIPPPPDAPATLQDQLLQAQLEQAQQTIAMRANSYSITKRVALGWLGFVVLSILGKVYASKGNLPDSVLLGLIGSGAAVFSLYMIVLRSIFPGGKGDRE